MNDWLHFSKRQRNIRSSKKWYSLKRKTKMIQNPNFEVMSYVQHCFYTFQKIVQTKDKTRERCEAIFRKDQVKFLNDLQHSCFYLEGNIS